MTSLKKMSSKYYLNKEKILAYQREYNRKNRENKQEYDRQRYLKIYCNNLTETGREILSLIRKETPFDIKEPKKPTVFLKNRKEIPTYLLTSFSLEDLKALDSIRLVERNRLFYLEHKLSNQNPSLS